MSALLPTFHTPNDVREYKDRLDPFVRAVDASVTICGAIDPATRRGWAEFARAWRRFHDDDTSWIDASATYETTALYETYIRAWQERLAPLCRSGAPRLPMTPRPPASTDPLSTLRVVAIAAAVAAVALSVKAVVR